MYEFYFILSTSLLSLSLSLRQQSKVATENGNIEGTQWTDSAKFFHKLVTSAVAKYATLARADIQRRGSILIWIVILSVYGADTIAEGKLLISPFLR